MRIGHSSHHQRSTYLREKIMNCFYVCSQLQQILEANIGARERLSSGGSTALEEQLQIIELAISSIRDEMRRRESARLIACLDG